MTHQRSDEVATFWFPQIRQVWNTWAALFRPKDEVFEAKFATLLPLPKVWFHPRTDPFCKVLATITTGAATSNGSYKEHITDRQGRIKVGATGAIALGPPLQGGPRDDIYLFWIKYSFEKWSWFKRGTRIQTLNSDVTWVSLMISLQVWLSASFSNHYWIWICSVLFNANIFEFYSEIFLINHL